MGALLPTESVLFFDAKWNGSAPEYQAIVGEIAERLGSTMIQIDIDDAIGGAIARFLNVVTVPTVVRISSGKAIAFVVGARSNDSLSDLLANP